MALQPSERSLGCESDDLRHAEAVPGASNQLHAEQADTLATAFSESTEDTVATKADILVLKADIANLRSELKTDIATLKTDVVRCIVTAITFNFLGTVGLMVFVAKLAAR